MKLQTALALSASVLFGTLFQAAAQDEGPQLPKVLRIIREEVKQGKEAAHESSEVSFTKMAMKYKYPAHYLGFTMTAGPSEVWFMEAYDSVMAIQNLENTIDMNAAYKADLSKWDSMDGELRSNSRTMIAVLHPEVSYRSEQFAQELGKTRYFGVTIMRVRPYMDTQFLEAGRQVVAAYQRAVIEQPIAVYQVVSGGPNGMYLVITPMKSLAAIDEAVARGKAMRDSMGSERMAALYKSASEVIAGSETYTMAIDPKISFVPKEMSEADPAFWMPKPAATSTKPAAKSMEKSGGGQ